MAIRDLFRPKWKHSSIEVRTAAVRSLDVQNDVQKLIDVATTEESATIRRVAIRKLVDLDVLTKIATNDADSSVRDAASKRRETIIVDQTKNLSNGDGLALINSIQDTEGLKALLLGLDNNQQGTTKSKSKKYEIDAKQSAILDLQTRALDKFDSKKDLADVYRKSKSDALRQLIIPRLDDEKLVKSIVTDESRTALALPLLGNIRDTALLEDIAKKAKLRKVRTEARKKIDTLLGKTVDPKAKLAAKKEIVRRNRLVKQAEALALSEDWKRADEQLDTLESDWNDTAKNAVLTNDNGLSDRFKKALNTFRKRYDVHQEAILRNEERIKKQSGPHEAVEHTSTTPSVEVKNENDIIGTTDLSQATTQHTDDIEPPQVLLDILTELEIAIDMPKVDDATVMYRKKLKAAQRYKKFLAGNTQLAARVQAAEETLNKRIESRKVARLASQQKRIVQYEQKIDKLKSLTNSTRIKECANALNQVKKACTSLKKLASNPTLKDKASALIESYEDLEKTIFDHLQVLKEKEDWLRWSNIKPKEVLCVTAESLKDEEDLNAVFEKLKQIQRDWKKTGPVPKTKSDELWERFKTACDAAYERCKEVVGDQDKRREDNLKRKTELCEKAEAIQDSEDYENTAAALKQMQADWRKIGRVPQAQSDDIWKRFRAACDHFFNRRKGVLEELDVGRMENLKAKQKLISDAEALKDSENWIQTAKKLKALQIEWKKVGQVPRTHANDIWKQFRAACDHFFERKLESENKPLKDNYRSCLAILEKIESLAGIDNSVEQPPQVAAATDITEPDKSKSPDEKASDQPSRVRQSVTEAEAIAAMSFDDDDLSTDASSTETTEIPQRDLEATDESAKSKTDNKTAPELSDEDWLAEILTQQKAWESRGELLPKDKTRVDDRYKACMEALVASHANKLTGSPLDPNTLLTKRQDLCTAIEALKDELNEEEAEKATLSGGNAAERLKQALAENSLGIDKNKEKKATIRRKLDKLEQSWTSLLPLNSEEAKKLEQNFFRAANELRAYT